MDQRLSPYFSSSYQEARGKILTAFNHAAGQVETYTHPLHTAPDGTPLCTDVLWLGPKDARAKLLISSGLHGIELFAGSAIQLKSLQDGTFSALPDDVAVVMIHALNPYGAFHERRVNEDNIDLNRNFIDWPGPVPESSRLTVKLQEALLPEKWNWPLILAKSLFYRLRYGGKELQAAIQGGQYSKPEGLFYGGADAAWSNIVFRDIASRCMDNTACLAHVDIHTGLGPRGHGELIMTDSEGSETVKRARQWWDAETIRSTASGTSVSANTQGSIHNAFNGLAPGNCQTTLVALEFGTQPLFKVLKALAFDNWVHGRDQSPDNLEKARQQMREAFAPRDLVWQEKVLGRGADVIAQAVQGLRRSLG